MKDQKYIAKTFSGLEEVLQKEIKRLGGTNVRKGKRAVYFEGNKEILYKTNYFSRTALRILMEIENFNFKGVDNYYLRCKNINWEKYFSNTQTFAINSTVVNSREFRNSMFASLKLKDAIADYFRDKTGKRPSVDTENPDFIIHVHIFGNSCTLSLDSSGESLHKRGYRVKQGEAPLNEVLAAGMIYLSGWLGNSDFLDPMCGSGTLPIEAAMIANNIPAARFRKSFAFENWNDFDSLLFDDIKKQNKQREFRYKIYAADVSAESFLNTQTNARRALVFNKIHFQKVDFKNLDLSMSNGTIIINPPYGERLQSEQLDLLYQMIGNKLKNDFTNNDAWIISSSLESFKRIALKTSHKMKLFNGALLCSYNHYRLMDTQ